MLQYHLSPQDFRSFIEKEEQFVLAFQKTETGFIPVIIHPTGKRRMQTRIESRQAVQDIYDERSDFYADKNNEIVFFVLFPQESLVSDFGLDETSGGKTLNPISRLIRLLHAERNQINCIFFFDNANINKPLFKNSILGKHPFHIFYFFWKKSNGL